MHNSETLAHNSAGAAANTKGWRAVLWHSSTSDNQAFISTSPKSKQQPRDPGSCQCNIRRNSVLPINASCLERVCEAALVAGWDAVLISHDTASLLYFTCKYWENYAAKLQKFVKCDCKPPLNPMIILGPTPPLWWPSVLDCVQIKSLNRSGHTLPQRCFSRSMWCRI